jgi:hypothetical protein
VTSGGEDRDGPRLLERQPTLALGERQLGKAFTMEPYESRGSSTVLRRASGWKSPEPLSVKDVRSVT